MNEVYSTSERERILTYLPYPQEEKTMGKLAKETDVSPAQAHKSLGMEEAKNLVEFTGKFLRKIEKILEEENV